MAICCIATYSTNLLTLSRNNNLGFNQNGKLYITFYLFNTWAQIVALGHQISVRLHITISNAVAAIFTTVQNISLVLLTPGCLQQLPGCWCWCPITFKLKYSKTHVWTSEVSRHLRLFHFFYFPWINGFETLTFFLYYNISTARMIVMKLPGTHLSCGPKRMDFNNFFVWPISYSHHRVIHFHLYNIIYSLLTKEAYL